MAFPFGILALMGGLALVFSSSSSSSGSGGTGTGGGGGGTGGGGGGSVDLMTCAQAIEALPDTPGAGGGPSLKTIIQGAMLSTVLTSAQLETIAQQLDIGAAAATTPQLKQAFSVAAACIRARKATAGTTGTGGGPPPGLSCETAFAALPPAVQSQIIDARKSASPAAIESSALTLEGLATLATGDTKTNLLLVAQCLRAGSSIGTSKPGGGTTGDVGTGGAPTGIASSPDKQWVQTVFPGDYASKITAVVFGPSPPLSRVEELINANNPTDVNGLNLGPVSRSWAAGTPGQTNGVLNWTRLPAGARLLIPKTWNQWIDTTGHNRGQITPFPKA